MKNKMKPGKERKHQKMPNARPHEAIATNEEQFPTTTDSQNTGATGMKAKLTFLMNLLTGSPMEAMKKYYTITTNGLAQIVTPNDDCVSLTFKRNSETLLRTKIAYTELSDIQLTHETDGDKLSFQLRSFPTSFRINIPKIGTGSMTSVPAGDAPAVPTEPKEIPMKPQCLPDTIYIYTDGSVHDGQAGWAFLAMKNGDIITEQNGAFKSNKSGDAEYKAMSMALRYARRNFGSKHGCKIIFRSDYKPMIDKINSANRNEKGKTACLQDRLSHSIYDLSCMLLRPHSFEWIKGHNGEKWNELVDHLAGTTVAAG